VSESDEEKKADEDKVSLGRRGGPLLNELKELSIPSVIEDDDPEGLLPTGSHNQPLLVQVPERWTNYAGPNEVDIVRLYWVRPNREPVPIVEHRVPGPITEDMFPLSLYVPKNSLQPDGRYEVWYEVYDFNGTAAPSKHRIVTLDSQPPSDNVQLEALLFPSNLPGLPLPTITNEYLQDNNDRVEFRLPLPLYTGADDRDELELFWSPTNPPTGTFATFKEISQAEIDAEDIRIDLTGDIIRAANQNGTFYAFYKLRDRAGNETLIFSKPAIGAVSLITWPGRLPPPTVPRHDDDNLVHRADARAQVQAVIGNIPGPLQPNDQIELVWGGIPLPRADAALPLVIPVPWDVLFAQGPGPSIVSVGYNFLRGGSSRPSEEVGINFDFTVAGQDHSNAPALLNTTLAKIEVRGPVSGLLNQLTGLDDGLPAPATLELYDHPQPLERIEVYWGSIVTPVDVYTVQPGDVAGQLIPFTIPWEAIEQDKNNRALPVYYTTDNGVNQQVSRVTEVDVSIVVIDNLKEPLFPHASSFGYLNCCSVPRLWEGVTVKIDGNVNFDGGDTVILTWQGCYNLNGTDPIPGVMDEFRKTLSSDEAINGFEIVILPYDRLIAPMENKNSGLAYYRLEKTNGGIGRSRRSVVKIDRTIPSGEVCSPTNDLCPDA